MECRILLYGYEGGHFANANMTYSFMPDGTSIGGVSSNLYQTFNAVTSTANWQLQVEKAAAVWQQLANINLALVSDNGAPVGSGSYQQGDPGMGDIRFGAVAQSGGVLAATTLPPPFNGGSAAGDIVFNSSQPWNLGSNYDIETVAIHELGHALGMGHSQVAAADMFAYYQGAKQALNPDDITGIQAIWGGPPSDPYSNQSMSSATDTWPLLDSNLQVAIYNVAIANNTDQQWYYVFVPWNTSGQMTVTMQTTNLSSLSPREVLYNASNVALAQASAPNSYGATVSLTYSVSPGQAYYIRASSANGGPGSEGAYGLEINLGSAYQPPVARPNTAVAAQPDQGGGSTNESVAQASRSRGLPRALHDAAVSAAANDVHLGSLVVNGELLTASPRFRLNNAGLAAGSHRPSSGGHGHAIHVAVHDHALSALGVARLRHPRIG